MTDRYSVRIGSEPAASKIHVEPLIWLWLREIAAERGIPLSHLMEEIDRCYRLQVLGKRSNNSRRVRPAALRPSDRALRYHEYASAVRNRARIVATVT